MYIDPKSSYRDWRCLSPAAAIILVCFFVRCTDNDRSASAGLVAGLVPTDVVSDLKIVETAPDRITISWTAPATHGQDLYYQIRHSEHSLTLANWNEGVVCPYVPPVADSGVTQSYDVNGLPAGDLSYVAIGVRSTNGALGPLSNNVSDTIPSLLTDPVSYSLAGNDVAAADFDADGDIDIVVYRGGEYEGSLYTLTNDGNGRFSQTWKYSTGGLTTEVRVADFDNDGFNDIAALSTTSVLVLTNDGTGRFSLTESRYAAQMTNALEVGDLNGDGYTDIIAAAASYYGKFEGNDEVLAIWFNNGIDGFGEWLEVSTGSVGCIRVFDADGDGDNDIATAYGYFPEVVLYYNDGTGRIWDNWTLVDFDMDATSVTPGDLNNDGKPELIAIKEYVPTLEVATGNDEDDYSVKIFTPAAGEGHDCHLGDFNGDGFLDIARAGYYILTLHINDGQGGFSGAACYPVNNEDNWQSADLEVADFNGDGHPDIAVVQNPGNLKIFFSSL